MSDFLWPIYSGGFPDDAKDIISYSVCSDGVYCKKNVFGSHFIIYKVDKIDGLGKVKEDVHPLAASKIPASLYFKTIDFFRLICKKFDSKLEAYIMYCMTPDGKYFLYVPEQTVTAASVNYSLEKFYSDNPGCVVVADAHSHQDMGAFWSGTDDADDCRDRYSIVIGKISKLIPEYKIRFSTAGKKRWDLQLEDLFCHDADSLLGELDLEEAVKNVNDHRKTYSTGSQAERYYGGFGLGYQHGRYGKNKDNRYPNSRDGKRSLHEDADDEENGILDDSDDWMSGYYSEGGHHSGYGGYNGYYDEHKYNRAATGPVSINPFKDKDKTRTERCTECGKFFRATDDLSDVVCEKCLEKKAGLDSLADNIISKANARDNKVNKNLGQLLMGYFEKKGNNSSIEELLEV